jgi:5'-nucleotidase
MENIVISDPANLEKLEKTISEGGLDKLHILADFDRTLTKAFVGGKSVPSLISVLRDGNYLTPDYARKANDLYEKYHKIEVDPNVSFEEKKKAMHEWWVVHFDLLIKSGLNKKDIERAVKEGRVEFREGFEEFADFLKQNSVPFVIMSSSGLGAESISLYLEKAGRRYDNIYIVSNSYEWDEKGNAVRVKQPIIHGMSKYEVVVKDFPFFEKIKDRKNVLLLGDNLDDTGMVEGFDCDNIIKIAFLNEGVEKNMDFYKKKYDVIITNDGSMGYVNNLLKSVAP